VQVFNFYEFFAGGGMVRAGLGPNWSCLFANDFDLLKAESYKSNSHVRIFRVRETAWELAMKVASFAPGPAPFGRS
jgi:site-specific DNA-cytosine methylase